MSRRGNAVAVSTICAVTFGIFFALGTVPQLLVPHPPDHLADPHASAVSGSPQPTPAAPSPASQRHPSKRPTNDHPALPTDGPELNAAATEPTGHTGHSHGATTGSSTGTSGTGGKTTTGSGTETEGGSSPSTAPSTRPHSPSPSAEVPSGTPTPHLDQASPSTSTSPVSPPVRHVPFLRWLYHMVRSVV